MQSWSSRPPPPRKTVTPYILNLVKRIEAKHSSLILQSMTEPLNGSLKTPEDDGQTGHESVF
ncbi:hypothetical protein GBAR_LOCUS18760 [Geodia barretti]|uniref:Uncharacterized protein n=1 Tax=Geodia barretti TaxID=519541 RepID=A0AA35SQ85_GEOBA|nr:hypothetical protein GBAR_LOCUS18760 [Geodia barretti]